MTLSDLVAPWAHHARSDPGRLAVCELAGESWTWGRLADEANRRTQQWRTAGVQPGERLALGVPAGADWVASVWAAWNCGLVWCPLPPETPKDLLRCRLEHLDPRWAWNGQRLIERPVQCPPCQTGAAYLIYTSGSTGVAKGVLVGAEGLPALWQAQARAFGTTRDTRAAWMLSPAFDASVSDVGVALTAGAALFVVPPGRWRTWRRWVSDVGLHRIDQVDAPPSWLALWSEREPPHSLRTLIAGGEPTPAPVLRAWSRRLRWVNVYGPTEATVCTSLEIRHVGAHEDVPATIGRPLRGVTYRLQNPDRSLPDGPEPEEGELWIGGGAVALGYWRDEERTAQRFAEWNGRRWFRTGDLVRRTRTNWVFVGRRDRQVKRNGQLLQLDDVEAILSEHPLVRTAVVFVDERDRLTAALEAPEIGDAELREWLKPRVCAWGVPQRWMRRESWPRTPTGKIDRLAVAADPGSSA